MKFYVDEYGTIDDAVTIPFCGTGKPLWLAAEQAAEYHHNQQGGWESTWPFTIVIIDDDLRELARYSVDREAVPHFNTKRVK